MSEIMSAKTSTSKYDGNDVVMFNLADDPYELYNVWDQNKSLGEELAAEIVNAGMSFSPLDGARVRHNSDHNFSKYDSNNIWNK